MRILQICTQMESGGAQRVAMILAREFRTRGHRVNTLFLYRKTYAFAGETGVLTMYPRKPSLLERIILPFRLLRIIQRTRPDVVITHTYFANVIGQFIATIAGIRSRIAVAHSMLNRYPWHVRIADLILGTIGCYSHHVFVSRSAAAPSAFYPHSYKSRIRIIYNGIHPADHGEVDVISVRRRWRLPEEGALVINVGRLSHVKNQKAILQAIAEIPNVHVVVVGTGDLRNDLESCAGELGISERVHLIGEASNEEVRALLRASDVFVFPSYFEAMPLAVIEAMAAGLPIVAADIESLREVAGNVALYVAPEDSKALAASIRSLLEDQGMAKELGRQAVIRATKFTVNRMADEYENLFA